MRLRGIYFGPVLGASGAQGFKGDGSEYPHHRINLPFITPNFAGMTFVSKTVTLNERNTTNGGNMDLDENLRMKEWFPKCIAINWRKKAVVNAVGLTNPGAEAMLNMGVWQKRIKPFFISFMPVGETRTERLKEFREFVYLLKSRLRFFHTDIGLQINVSCANAKLDTQKLLHEIETWLNITKELGIPILLKFSVTQIGVEEAIEICSHEQCDGICVSNAILWNDLPEHIQMSIFGSTQSPLRRRGLKQDGAYSGSWLLHLVEKWVIDIRAKSFNKHINAGGGIFTRNDIFSLKNAGASSVFLGSVAMLRPWDVQHLIRSAHNIFKEA